MTRSHVASVLSAFSGRRLHLRALGAPEALSLGLGDSGCATLCQRCALPGATSEMRRGRTPGLMDCCVPRSSATDEWTFLGRRLPHPLLRQPPQGGKS